jgi:hypothetical protein
MGSCTHPGLLATVIAVHMGGKDKEPPEKSPTPHGAGWGAGYAGTGIPRCHPLLDRGYPPENE